MPRIEIGPPPASPQDDDRPRPIGVPDDYMAPSNRPGGEIPLIGGIVAPPTPPRYYTGDEWLPAGMSAEDVARLQRMMDDAGVLTGTYRLGVWDETSRTAYSDVLSHANAAGLSVEQALAEIGAAPEVGEQAGRNLPTFNVSNPDDLRAIFKTAAQNTIGKFVPDDQIEAMISAYQSAQMAPQQQQTADQLAGGGGTVTSAPSPQTFAEAEIRKRNPVEAESNDQVRVFGDLMQILSGAGMG